MTSKEKKEKNLSLCLLSLLLFACGFVVVVCLFFCLFVFSQSSPKGPLSFLTFFFSPNLMMQ